VTCLEQQGDPAGAALPGGGDFAELLRALPARCSFLGWPELRGGPVHNGSFNPDERSLAVGVKVLRPQLLLWMERRVEIPLPAFVPCWPWRRPCLICWR